MDNNDFKQFIVEKFMEMERRLTEIEQRLSRIEGDWKTVKRVAWVILSIVLAKLGVDVSGVMGGG